MRTLWVSLIFLLGLATASCASSQSSTPTASERQQNSTQQEISPELSRDITETADTPTQIAPTIPNLESEDMIATLIPGSIEEKMVTLAREHLARNLGVPVNEIVLSEVKKVQWRDASLGCPKPGIDYIRVETPGYVILLELDGKTYNYHTDKVKRIVRCVR